MQKVSLLSGREVARGTLKIAALPSVIHKTQTRHEKGSIFYYFMILYKCKCP